MLKIHRDAWSAVDILVLGGTATRPMNIEQQLADAEPSIEVQLHSFENYNDAFDECKSIGRVGMIFICDDLGLPVGDIVDNLLEPYQTATGFSGGAVVLYDKDHAPSVNSTIKSSQNILDFYKIDDLMNSAKTRAILGDVWRAYITHASNQIFPTSVKNLVQDYFFEKLGDSTGLEFQGRLINLLSPKLNLSWLDLITLRHAPCLVPLIQANYHAINSLTLAKRLMSPLCNVTTPTDLSFSKDKNTDLLERVYRLSLMLEAHRKNGSLETFLDQIASKKITPFASTFEKVLNSHTDDIKRLAKDTEDFNALQTAG